MATASRFYANRLTTLIASYIICSMLTFLVSSDEHDID